MDHRSAALRLWRAAQPVLLCLTAFAASADGSWRATPTAIKGTARLGWHQPSSSQDQLSGLRFMLVIDNAVRVELSGVACGTLAMSRGVPRTAPCSAPLPSLDAGAHTLALVAIDRRGAESSRSPEIPVVVTQTATQTAASSPALRETTENSAAQAQRSAAPRTETSTLGVRIVAAGFVDPTDLALLPDGRVLVAERAGRIQAVNRGLRQAVPALQIESAASAGGVELLALAVDPAFARTGFVYAAYTNADGFHVTRFREAGGTLSDPVALLDGIPASARPTAALRFGPDGKLYVALDDGGDPSTPGDFGSYNGKVLRLNADGTVPGDQPGYSPVLVPNVAAPRSLTWSARDGRLWIAEGRTTGAGMVDVVEPGMLEGDTHSVRARPHIVSRHVPPDGQVPFSILAYRGSLVSEWAGDLLMTLPEAQQLVRLRPDRTDPTHVASTSVVVSGPLVGPMGAMAVDVDGVIYLISGDRLLALASTAGPALP